MSSLTRRQILDRAVRVGTGLVAGAAFADAANARPAESPTPRLKIIAAGGHPGDAEYGCGGTVARYVDLGHEVVLLHLNNGEYPKEKGGRRPESASPKPPRQQGF